MDKLINAIEPALLKLSETLNISIDFLRENAMYYVLEYGKYYLMKEIITGTILATLAGVIISCIIIVIACVDYYNEDWKYSLKTRIIIFLTPIIIFQLFNLAPLLLYLITPEIYSLEAVLQLIQ